MVARRSFRLTSFLGMSLLLFYPNTDIINVLQGIFTHDLFDGKFVMTGFKILWSFKEADPVFVDIIHPGSQPFSVFPGQWQIELKFLYTILPRFLYGNIDVDITEMIFLIVP